MRARRSIVTAGVTLTIAASCLRAPAEPPDALDTPCRRVIPASPALAAIMVQSGLAPCVVGITRWTRLPEGITRPVVGDGLTLDTEAVLALEPDLLLVQTSRTNEFDRLRQLRPSLRVRALTVETLADVRQAALTIGEWCGELERARQAVEDYDRRLDSVRRAAEGRARPRVLFVTGTDRPFVAGPGNFIAELIERAGGVNAGSDIPGLERWRRTDLEGVIGARPDVMICQVGDPREEAAVVAYWSRWAAIPASRTGRIHVVSDPDWTIPSLRLAELAEALLALVHPPE